MIRPLRNAALAAVALVAAVVAGEILWRSWTAHSAEPAVTASIPHVAPAYAPQRVVYHVAENGGFLGRGFKKLLQVASNHVEALETGQLDLRIVLQGDGVDLLTDARGDTALAARIDTLKAKGVRFLVCGNTLRMRKIEASRLHGIAPGDVVRAGVAEITALQQQGYVYVKPL